MGRRVCWIAIAHLALALALAASIAEAWADPRASWSAYPIKANPLVGDPAGGIWFGTADDIGHLDRCGRRSRLVGLPRGLGPVVALIRDQDGSFWAFTKAERHPREATALYDLVHIMADGTFGVKGSFRWSDGLIAAYTSDRQAFWIGGDAGVARLSKVGKVSGRRQFDRWILGLASSLDGSLWFTAPVSITSEGMKGEPDFIGHRTPDGRISLFSLGSDSPFPGGLAVVDGVAWFSLRHGLGRIDAFGHQKSFTDPTKHSFAEDLIAARDGSLWLVDRVLDSGFNGTLTRLANRLVHFRAPATFKVYDIPDEPIAPTGVSHPAEDGDGTIWVSLPTEPRVVALRLSDTYRTKCRKGQHSGATRSAPRSGPLR